MTSEGRRAMGNYGCPEVLATDPVAEKSKTISQWQNMHHAWPHMQKFLLLLSVAFFSCALFPHQETVKVPQKHVGRAQHYFLRERHGEVCRGEAAALSGRR